jgi:hypothetical protein
MIGVFMLLSVAIDFLPAWNISPNVLTWVVGTITKVMAGLSKNALVGKHLKGDYYSKGEPIIEIGRLINGDYGVGDYPLAFTEEHNRQTQKMLWDRLVQRPTTQTTYNTGLDFGIKSQDAEVFKGEIVLVGFTFISILFAIYSIYSYKETLKKIKEEAYEDLTEKIKNDKLPFSKIRDMQKSFSEDPAPASGNRVGAFATHTDLASKTQQMLTDPTYKGIEASASLLASAAALKGWKDQQLANVNVNKASTNKPMYQYQTRGGIHKKRRITKKKKYSSQIYKRKNTKKRQST